MKKLETEIIINSSPENVWNILIDFQKFSEWNPFILSIEGEQKVGAQLKVVLKNGNGISVFTPEILVYEKNCAFEWLGSLPLGLFNGQHKFHIEKISETQVKFIHSEQFSGLLAGLLLKFIGEQTCQGFIAMNEALKKRAEQ